MSGDALTMGTANINVYLLDTTKTYLNGLIHWPHSTQHAERKGEALV